MLTVLVSAFAVVAAVFGAVQIALRLLAGPTEEIRTLARDCHRLFEKTANGDVRFRVYIDMMERTDTMQHRTHWPIRGYIEDLQACVEWVHANTPRYPDYLEHGAIAPGGYIRTRAEQEHVDTERWAASMLGQETARKLLKRLGQLERWIVGGR